jgi:hypothetical protein
MENNKIDIYELDPVSFEVQDTNSRILLNAFDDYASLVKYPPFSLDANVEKTKAFINEVRELHYKWSAEPVFEENFRPYKGTEKKYSEMLAMARRYREDSNGSIDTAARIYENENPDEKLSLREAIGGHLEL